MPIRQLQIRSIKRPLRVIKIVSPLLKQYTHQTPESPRAIFPQYYTEEKRGRLSMEAHPSVFEDKPFYQGTENQARPDVVYAEVHRERIPGRVQRPPQKARAYEHQ